MLDGRVSGHAGDGTVTRWPRRWRTTLYDRRRRGAVLRAARRCVLRRRGRRPGAAAAVPGGARPRTAPAERLRLFLIQYWGGPTTYSDERGHPRLRMRHMPFHIGREERDALAGAHDARPSTRRTAALRPAPSPRASATPLLGYFNPAAETAAQRHRSADLGPVGPPLGSPDMPAISAPATSSSTTATLQAVDGLSFEVAEGEVYALLGENGAGKSTTVEILEGHRTRTSGDVAVLGADPGTAGAGVPRPHRHRAADVRGRARADGRARPSTSTAPATATVAPVDEVVELVGLTPQLDQRVGTLSGGQRRRLDLALGHRRSPGAAVPRRADDRVRPGGAPPGVGAHPPARAPAAPRCC